MSGSCYRTSPVRPCLFGGARPLAWPECPWDVETQVDFIEAGGNL